MKPGIIKNRMRWSKPPRRFIMILLSLLMFAGPLNNFAGDTAQAQTGPVQDICVEDVNGPIPSPGRVVQNCDLRRAGLAQLEYDVIMDMVAMHQLPISDRSSIVTWERDTVRASMLTKIFEMIEKDPAERTPTEQSIVDAMTLRVMARRIAAIQFAIEEYEAWAVAPCGYAEPYETEWEYDYAWCSGNPAVVTFRGPNPPSLENFLYYGQMHVYGAFVDGGPAFRITSGMATSMGLIAGVTALGIATAVGAAIGSTFTTSTLLLAQLFPNLVVAANIWGSSAATSAVVGAAGATSVAAAVAFIVMAVVIAIIQIIQVVADAQIPDKLNDALAQANVLVDLRALIASEQGRNEIAATFVLETLPDYFPGTAGPAATAGDPSFIITGPNGLSAHYPDFKFQCWHPIKCGADFRFTARLSGGWFVTRNSETGVERLTLGVDYVGWDGLAWTAWRVGPRQFLHTVAGGGVEPLLSDEIKYRSWDGGHYIATLNALPEVPGAPVASPDVSDGNISVTWSDPPDATNYDDDGDALTYTLQHCDANAELVPHLEGTFPEIYFVWTNPSCVDIATNLTTASWATPVGSPEPHGAWVYRVNATDGYGTTVFSADSTPIIADRIPPRILSREITPPPNESGWNNTDVTASWTCTDLMSLQADDVRTWTWTWDPEEVRSGLPSGELVGTATKTLSTDGLDQSITGGCVDNVGNVTSETIFGLNIDKTPPDVQTGGPYVFNEGSIVVLGGQDSADATSGVASLDWESEGESPFSGDDGPLTRTFELHVVDRAGNLATDSTTVTINNIAPTATFAAPEAADEGSNITLSLSDPSDPSTADTQAGFSYAFDCGGGYGDFSSSSSMSCLMSDSGTFAVKGKIQDKDGGVSEYSATVAVNNLVPTATFVTPELVGEGNDITLLLSDPLDPSSADVLAGFTYAFDCGDGAGYGAFSSTNNAICPTIDNGVRDVRAMIRDKDGGETEYTATVTISNLAPIVNFGAAPLPVLTTELLTMSSEATDAPGDELTTSFDCGDGTAVGDNQCQFTRGGAYQVGVTVTDDDGASTIETLMVPVYDPESFCVSRFGGEIRMADADSCGRSETAISLPMPEYAQLSLCVNTWNGSVRMGTTCGRSDDIVLVNGQDTLAICVNNWNGALRVSQSCSRSESQDWL